MRLPAALLAAALAWSCAPSPDAPAGFRIPRPSLSGVDEKVRVQLEERASAVELRLSDSELRAGEAAAAIGELGRYYHAYDLTTDAEICYREAARRAPGAEWYYHLGFLDQMRGELGRAAESYRAVLELEPDDSAARLRLADVLAQLGQAEPAAELYAAAVAAPPVAAAAHRGLGRLAAEAGRHLEAIAHFESALELQPEATALHHPLAQAYGAAGDPAAARRHAQLAGPGQVAFADPRVAALDELAVGAGVRLARGGVALATGRTEAALDEYRRAVAAAPENPAARTNLALVLASTGELDAAREQLDEALRLEPANLEATLALAHLVAAAGEHAQAVELFGRALEVAPEEVQARRGRAASLLALGGGERALDDLRAVVAEAPADAWARLQLGSVLQEGGDPDGAELHYRAALDLGLESEAAAAVHLSLGNLSAERGALEAALDDYEAALAGAPGLAEAIYNRAGVLARAGRLREAAAEYARYLDDHPEHGAARFYLGDALLRSGDPRRAIAAFERIAASDPRYERARLGIAVALKRAGRAAAALASLEESLAALPRSGLLAHELALTLASSADRSLRDGRRAVELAGGLFASHPSPLHAETLAMALAEAGRFDEAVDIQSRLVGDATNAGDGATATRLRAALELYRAGEPCCAPPN